MDASYLCVALWRCRVDGCGSHVNHLANVRFADAATMITGKRGYDRVRNTEIALMDFKCAWLAARASLHDRCGAVNRVCNTVTDVVAVRHMPSQPLSRRSRPQAQVL